LFRRLAVFVDGCTLEAAEAVCNADGNLPIDVLDGCTALVDNSLLQQMEGVDGAPRFTMLETIREYALECLEASGEEELMRRWHANFFLTFAEAIEPKLTSADRSIWLERLDAEYSNLRASLSWSKETGNTELWLRLAAAMGWFWHFEGYYSEGRRWLAAALAQPALPSNSQVSLKALRSMGVLAFFQSDYIEARDWLEKSVTMARKLNDQRELAYALLYLASVRLWQGDYTPAHDFAEESVAIFREIGDKWSIALSLLSVGFVALDLGNYERARRSLEESLALRRELDDKLGIAYVLGVLGEVVRRQGDHRRAIVLTEEGLARSRELRLKMAIGLALLNLGELAHYHGDYGRARDLLRESLAMYRDLGLKRDIARCLEALTGLASAEGQPEHGVRLCAAAAALRDRIDAPLPTSERADHDRSLAAMRAQLSAVAFATGWAEGHAMTLDQAIVYALQTPTSRV
jgi:non-specific serine/threonine protein kinase